VSALTPTYGVLQEFVDGLKFLVSSDTSQYGDTQVGGPGEVGKLLAEHLELSGSSILFASMIAIPAGLYLGHLGKGQFIATSVSNVGRAVPSLAIIAFFFAYFGPSKVNIILALTLLAIPPLFTNTYVGVRQVDSDTVDASKGMGFSGFQVLSRVELPLAVPLIFGGLRTAAVSVVATATIAPLAGVQSLGTPLVARGVYGSAGQIGAAIAVALLAVLVEVAFAALQRAVTPRGLKLAGEMRHQRRASFLTPTRRIQTP
jgi:osmoprotectant transport system permease protein